MAIITFLSDFGKNNLHTGLLKGAVMRTLAGAPATMVDVCHCISRAGFINGAYLTAAACRHYPSGTVHILAAGLHTAKRLLVVAHGSQFYIVPDNGLASLLPELGPVTTYLVAEFAKGTPFRQWLPYYVNALAAIVADQLQQYPLTDILVLPFSPCKELRGEPVRAGTGKPIRTAAFGLECEVLYVDRFNNITLHINREEFMRRKGDMEFLIKVPGMPAISTISEHYGAVAFGEPLCRFNSLDYLEIAVNSRYSEDAPMPADEKEHTELIVRNNLNSDRVIDFATVTINFLSD